MPFLGMRGTGDWATNQDPESWGQQIFKEEPNGSSPIFAMQSMFPEETDNSHTFNWWTKTMPDQSGALTNVYIDAGLETPYVYATHQATFGIAGQVVYAKIAQALAEECKQDHLVTLRDTDQIMADVKGRITDVVYDGANSYVAIKLIEADDNHTTSSDYNIATADRFIIHSNAVPEGSVAPEAVGYDPVQYTNYMQETRDTYDLTNFALASELRTGDPLAEEQWQCLQLHGLQLEKTALWGQKSLTIGANKKRIFTTQGMFPFLLENNPTNIVDFKNDTDASFAGKTWLQAGRKFLHHYLSVLSTYIPSGEVFAVGGNQAFNAINELAETYGQFQLTRQTVDYGMQVTTWTSPSLVVHLRTHPLLSREVSTQRMMMLYHPTNVKFKYLVGGSVNGRTQHETDMQLPGQHSKLGGYTTIGGWKFNFPNQFMAMLNLGLDNDA